MTSRLVRMHKVIIIVAKLYSDYGNIPHIKYAEKTYY